MKTRKQKTPHLTLEQRRAIKFYDDGEPDRTWALDHSKRRFRVRPMREGGSCDQMPWEIGYLIVVIRLAEAAKNDRFPTLIYINQTRYKVGVMFGDPETMPGGNAPRFQAGLWLRVYGKNEIDPKVSQAMPVRKDVKFVVKKWKCPILQSSGQFQMATIAHNGLGVGQCDDWNTVSQYLKDFGQFEKDPKKGWLILGEHYDTIQPFREKLFNDKEFGSLVRREIIDRLIAGGNLIDEGDHDE